MSDRGTNTLMARRLVLLATYLKEKEGLGLGDLARRLGIDSSYLSRILSSDPKARRSSVGMRTIDRVAQAVPISVDYFTVANRPDGDDPSPERFLLGRRDAVQLRLPDDEIGLRQSAESEASTSGEDLGIALDSKGLMDAVKAWASAEADDEPWSTLEPLADRMCAAILEERLVRRALAVREAPDDEAKRRAANRLAMQVFRNVWRKDGWVKRIVERQS